MLGKRKKRLRVHLHLSVFHARNFRESHYFCESHERNERDVVKCGGGEKGGGEGGRGETFIL